MSGLDNAAIMDLSASPGTKADVMNDPAFDTNSKGKQRSLDDSDTCRICRGEGSKDEPLFHPCKCSGSIKYVHQNCLMEWLAHSQKKHCELCKTPFRFTKLYASHMPTSVPFPIFLRQAAVHTWKTLLTWSRFHLVLFVWIAWLPWCMRAIWRGLFWVGDGGWIYNWHEMEKHSVTVARTQLDKLATEGTTPSRHALLLSKDAAASAVVSHMAKALPRMLSPVSQTLNFTNGEPTIFSLTKRFLQGMVGRGSNYSLPVTPLNATSHFGEGHRQNSWLSDFSILRSLTRSPMLNNMVIDTLEGQLITLLVVIAFILIFLIREWVVQQQPGINMGDLDADEAEVQANPLPALEQLARQHAEQRLRHAPLDEALAEARNGEGQPEELVQPLQQPQAATQLRITGRPQPGQPIRPRTEEQQEDEEPQGIDSSLESDHTEDSLANHTLGPSLRTSSEPPFGGSEAGSSHSNQRPVLPAKDVFTVVTDFQRTLEEEVKNQDSLVLETFLDLWHRADRKPNEVIKLIDAEGRNEELAWLVKAMRSLEDASRLDKNPNQSDDSNEKVEATGEQQSNSSNSSWQLVDEDTTQGVETAQIVDPNVVTQCTMELGDAPYTEEVSESGSIARYPGPRQHRIKESGLTDRETAPKIIGIPASLQNTSRLGNVDSLLDHALDAGEGVSKSDSEESGKEVEGLGFSSEPETTPLSRAGDSSSRLDDIGDNKPPVDQHPVSTRAAGIGTSNLDQELSLSEFLAESSAQLQGNDQQSVPDAAPAPRPFREMVMEWLWGGVVSIANHPEHPGEDDEHIVHDFADEAPFVPVANGQAVIEEDAAVDHQAQDPEVVAAAAEAGVGVDANDAEAVDDGDDLEGIMELVGMQGPLAGLVQNAMFCAVIVAVTVFIGIWIPYIAGKVFLVFLTNPVSLLIKLPLRWASTAADVIIDSCVFVAGCAFYWVDTVIRLISAPVGWGIPFVAKVRENRVLATTAKSYAEGALERLAKTFMATGDSLYDSEIPIFSIVAHQSLHTIEGRLMDLAKATVATLVALVDTSPPRAASIWSCCKLLILSVTTVISAFISSAIVAAHGALDSAPSLLKINPLSVGLNIPQRTTPLDYELVYWDSRDRTTAIILGYTLFSVIGATYLKASVLLQGKKNGQKAQGAFADLLYQAGGVMKVIVIISIEMIVFPLYCGLLLDVALLPLFGNVTLVSRINFTLTSPNTSLFVHWFIGTCYMFHFALFVSMCRKIMRTGVLYFIRDPDDPTFHPVRDVLERSVSTQLRKIAFSALVYGALVILCLGGVVWGISYAFVDVLPIHWSSNEPVLEFPVDLLFYNFLMPLAVKFFKPSEGLNKMYGWWFHKCARVLRLTHFLFGERKEDEEGRHMNRTWRDLISGKRADAGRPVIGVERRILAEYEQTRAVFVRDGRYVRAPASDQVRLPKGTPTFIEIDEEGERVDGQADTNEGLHGRQNKMFSDVYVPPFFRLRISLFISLIWLFAAVTGVGITIIPLVLGRLIFANLIPQHVRMNDIYAFSIGIYLLGGILYAVLQYRNLLSVLHHKFNPHKKSNVATLRQTAYYMVRILGLLYTIFSFAFLLPSLFALMMEFYLVIPLHTYFGGSGDRHIIHFIQDWTLGVLYIKMAGRLILWSSPSRPAEALRAIVRNGWSDPDIRLATRGFILPASVAMLVAIGMPLPLGWVANKTYFTNGGDMVTTYVYRYSYPALLAIAMLVGFCFLLGRAFKGWRQKIRDEVYLIGERLHNFGERRGAGVGAGVATGRRVTI